MSVITGTGYTVFRVTDGIPYYLYKPGENFINDPERMCIYPAIIATQLSAYLNDMSDHTYDIVKVHYDSDGAFVMFASD